MTREKCDAGLATDGDADRIGAVAEDGSFVDSHKIFCVLLRWLLERKRWPGDVVRAFNTTRMLDRIAAKHGRKLYETQIGFKYTADLMMEHDILIGGEESGGIGYSRFLPERDGMLNCLLLANVMAEEGQDPRPTGRGLATRIRAALLWAARSAHSRRGQTERDSAGAVGKYAEPGTLSRGEERESRRHKVFSRRADEWQWSGGMDSVSSFGNRASAAGLLRGRFAGVGDRNPHSR